MLQDGEVFAGFVWTGAAVDDGWEGSGEVMSEVSPSLLATRLGSVMGIADLVELRVAIAEARAR